MVVKKENSIHYFTDSQTQSGIVELFHDIIFIEDLKYNALKDGIILRFDSTTDDTIRKFNVIRLFIKHHFHL